MPVVPLGPGITTPWTPGNGYTPGFGAGGGDTIPPTITGTPSNITAEATSAFGAAVTYAAPTATDNVDGTDAVSCAPASGSIFALGTATVTCSATDRAGNASHASFSVTVRDTTAPAVSLTAPSNGATVSGSSVTLSSTASDSVGVAGVQFKVNGSNIGAEVTSSPYSVTWNSTATSSGSKAVVAVARDAAGNYATSTLVTITVDNTPPVISAISSGTPGTTGATITWTTDEASNSQVNYGATSAYGATTTLDNTLTTSHSVNITGLNSNTTYHFRVRSADNQNNLAVSSDQTLATQLAALPSGALGVWYMDQYQASPRPAVPNAVTAVATSADLFGAPRRLFGNARFWTGASVVDASVTAPDGSNDASTLTTTGNWGLRLTKAGTLPAGTYTVAINAKRNTGTDQQFAFSKDSETTLSSTMTATSAWQRFSYTFTLGASADIRSIWLCSFDRSTGANLQISDFELYAGSSDLGPQVLAGHLYPGAHAYDTAPSYSGGVLDLTNSAFGAIQLGTAASLSTVTAMAVAQKTATGGSGFQVILSKIQNGSDFLFETDQSGAAASILNNAKVLAQSPGIYEPAGMGWHTFSLRVDGTYVDLFIDDVRLLRATATPSGAITLADMFVNEINAAGLFGNLKLNSIALWPSALSDAELGNARTVLQQRAAASSLTVTPAARVYVAEGDSITGAFTYSYPYLFATSHASPAVWGANYAVAGSGLSDLNARAAVVDGILPANRAGRTFILSVLNGANNLTFWPGASDAAAMADYLTQFAAYCDARRAAGWKVVVITVTPRNDATFNARRAIVNSAFRTSWVGVHAGAIADFAADPTMGPDAAASNTTYYADGVHPTAAGQAILETIIRPVINGL